MNETKFTDQTWADLGPSGLTAKTGPRYWMNQHDLAVEAQERTFEFCRLSHNEWETLITAVVAELPVEITYRGRTSTCMVTSILTLSSGTYANLYMRTWGFSHPIALSELEKVEAPSTVYHNSLVS